MMKKHLLNLLAAIFVHQIKKKNDKGVYLTEKYFKKRQKIGVLYCFAIHFPSIKVKFYVSGFNLNIHGRFLKGSLSSLINSCLEIDFALLYLQRGDN